MTVTVVVGGQFGSEGKGKITSHLCKNHDYTVAVRCGGPNSGHTVTIDNEQVVLQQIPAGVVNPKSKLYISAGCLINLRLLLEEIKTFGLDENRIKIDKNAAIIEDEQIKNEIQDSLNEKIGSTCTGVGSTVASRALRRGNLKFARDIPELKKYLTTVSKDIMRHYHHKDNIVIEGTQGYGLSLYHSQYYPFTTSRDTTASCFLSEVGISPLVVENVIMVIRTFPIRVSGNSGPLPKEIDWGTIQLESGYPNKIEEYTSVSKKLRRVGRFDLNIVKDAINANSPSQVALMGTDYLDYKNRSISNSEDLTDDTKEFITWFENETSVKINYLGTGPFDSEIIDLGGCNND